MGRYVVFVSQVVSRGLVIALILLLTGVFSTPASAVKKLSVETGSSAITTNLGLYGGNTWDIAVSGERVYTIASGTPNGFFFSSDAAATWQRPAGSNDFGSGQSVEINATTGDVFIGLGGDLYKSTDYGVTLTKILADCGNPLVVAGSTVLCGWNNQVKVSTDNGATFSASAIAVGTDSLWSLAASKTAGTFYATTYSGSTGASTLYQSVDTGATWTALTTAMNNVALAGFTTVRTNPYNEAVLAIGDDHHTWISINSGATWTALGISPARSCNTIATWTSAGKLYACGGFSTDNGATFTDMNYSGTTRGPGKIIVVNASDENILYGDSMSGMAKSTDGGLTWTKKNEGITAVNVLAISVSADKKTAWSSSSQGLAKSTNFDSAVPTWTFPILPCTVERCDPSGIGESVWVKPDDANVVLAGSIGGFIFRSIDAGATWTMASSPTTDDPEFIDSGGMSSLRPYAFVNDPNDPNIVYTALAGYPTAGTHLGAVLKSTDAGATWTDMNFLGTDEPALSLAVSPTGVVYVGTWHTARSYGVYRFADNQWSYSQGIPADVDVYSIVVDPDSPSTLYAAASGDAALGHDGFFLSSDSGATWTQVTSGLTNYLGFQAITIQKSTTPNTLYLSGRNTSSQGVLLKSSDGGATWGLLFQGLKSETYNTVVFDALLAGNSRGLYAVQSKAKLTIKSLTTSVRKGKVATITGTLKDSATNKILKNRKVKVYRKTGSRWVYQKQVTTNSKGLAKFTVRIGATRIYKFVWSPSVRDKAEYAKAESSFLTVRVRK